MWLRIHVGIKVNLSQQKGTPVVNIVKPFVNIYQQVAAIRTHYVLTKVLSVYKCLKGVNKGVNLTIFKGTMYQLAYNSHHGA